MEPGVEAERAGEAPEAPARPVLPPWAGAALVIIGVGIIALALLWSGVLGSPRGTVTEPGPGVTVSPGISSGASETPPPSFSPLATTAGTTYPTPTGPPGFTVAVSPMETTAARGDTVVYHMTIDAQNGFSGNVSMKLTASVLFFLSNTYDLGTQGPPYPETFEYALEVPDTLLPGTTVDGVLTSTGDGITRENRLVLHVQ
jgi:hypothetical protein